MARTFPDRLLLDPNQFQVSYGEAVAEAIEDLFPVETKDREIVVTNVKTDPGAFNDYKAQYDSKMYGGSLLGRVFGDVKVTDKKTGKVIVEKKGRTLAQVPVPTDRMTFIVDGSEYVGKTQTRLKSGPYTRLLQTGDAETDFNLSRGENFKLIVSPREEKVRFHLGGSTVSPKAFFLAAGIPEEEGPKIFGDRLWSKNLKSDAATTNEVAKLYHRVFDKKGVPKERLPALRKYFNEETQTLPETTKILLGKPYEHASSEMIAASARRTMDLVKGKIQPDLREELHFKWFIGPEDAVSEIVSAGKRGFQTKVARRLNRYTDLDEIIPAEALSTRVRSVISGSSGLFERPEQYNQIQVLSSQLLTNPLGFGGITKDHQLTRGMRTVYPSYFPFLDPAHSPEGSRTGINQRLSLLSVKSGRSLKVPVLDRKTGKPTLVTPLDVVDEPIAPRDELKQDGSTALRNASVRTASSPDGMAFTPRDKVRYVSPYMGLSLSTAMIPFVQHNSPNRVIIAGRHVEQAVSLKDREVPVIQSRWPSESPDKTEVRGVEDAIGRLMSKRAPEGGKVSKVSDNAIEITKRSGEKVTVNLAKHLPLNEMKAHLTHTPQVKVGDTVKSGDLIADSQNTRDGSSALGVHLRTGFFQYRALSFEDGAVISEDAAKKLTSSHSYLKRMPVTAATKMGKAGFIAHYPEAFSPQQLHKLDAKGLIKKGVTVNQGDPLAITLVPNEQRREHIILKGIKSSLVRPFKPEVIKWESPYPGEVTDVSFDGKDVRVSVVTDEPMQVGDKISGRGAHKSIVTAIIPQDQMPRDEEGKPLDVIYSAAGVVGRINPGMIWAGLLAKASRRTGARYIVDNFSPDADSRVYKIVDVKGHTRSRAGEAGSSYRPIKVKEHTRITEHAIADLVAQELEEAGMKAEERIYDPLLKTHYDAPVLVTDTYWMKLAHQVDKKLQGRGYGGSDTEYDTSMVPKGGGHHGAQALGVLGLYAALSAGLSHNLQEMYTSKSNLVDTDFWTAVMNGHPLPPPKVPFAMDRFHAYLKAMRVDPRREGNTMRFIPMSDEDVDKLSRGDLANPDMALRGKDLKPIPGGLFDEKTTGGLGGGGWSAIALPIAVPNPIFERAIQCLLGLTKPQYEKVLSGKAVLGADGYSEEKDAKGVSGIEAIASSLRRIDPKTELKRVSEELKTARKSDLDKHVKRYTFLRALVGFGKKPEDVYLMRKVPVLPPVFRPVTEMASGDLNIGDTNSVYKVIGTVAKSMEDWDVYPPAMQQKLYATLTDSVRSVYGMSGSMNKGDSPDRGVVQLLGGVTSPKEGYFLSKIVGRRSDMTGRSTIIPDLNLGIDEIGIPEEMGLQMFRPLLIRNLVQRGYTSLDAAKHVDAKDDLAKEALTDVASRWLVLGKRDPALHRYNIIAGRPKIVNGQAIRINPLWCGPLGADFDGDQVSMDHNVLILLPKSRTKSKTLNCTDFPRGRELPQRGNVLRWEPSEPMEVFGYDPQTGGQALFPVEEIQTHLGKEMFKVTLRSGKELFVSADHSLCVYHPILNVVTKASPLDVSNGWCVPVLPKYADQDTVPVPLALSTVFENEGSVPRARARENVGKCPNAPEFWLKLIDRTDLRWEPITKIEATGRVEDGFDLKVPGSWTFALDNGVIVWDSMTGPISYQDKDGAWVADIESLAEQDADDLKVHRYGDQNVDFALSESLSFSVHNDTDMYRTRTNQGRVVDVAAGASLIGYCPFTLRYDKIEPQRSRRWFVPIPRLIANNDMAGGAVCGHEPTKDLGKALGYWLAGSGSGLPEEIEEQLAEGRIPGIPHKDSAFRLAMLQAVCSACSVQEGVVALQMRDRVSAHAAVILLMTFGISSVAEKTTSGWVTRVYKGHNKPLSLLVPVPAGAQMTSDPDLVPFPKIFATALERLGADLSPWQKWIRGDFIPRAAALRLSAEHGSDILWLVAHNVDGRYEVVERGEAGPVSVPIGANFLRLAKRKDTRWDRIASAEFIGTFDSYDITVADTGNPTILTASGIPVQDTMSVYVPVSEAAVVEARKALPSRTLFEVASKAPVFTPSLDAQLGLFMLTLGPNAGAAKQKYSSLEEATKDKAITFAEPIEVNGLRTSRGRAAVYQAIPEEVRGNYGKLLSDPGFQLDKGATKALIADVSEKVPEKSGAFVDELKNLGFSTAQLGGASFGLNDLRAVPGVAAVVQKAEQKVIALSGRYKGDELVARSQKIYGKALEEVERLAEAYGKETGNRLYLMGKGGVKTWTQVRQFVAPPVGVYATGGMPVATPVSESYGEGLRGSSFLAASAAARAALVDKTQSVSEPGALSKELVASAVDVRIEPGDAGVRKALHLPIGDTKDIEGRFTAEPIQMGTVKLPKNTKLTTKLIRDIRASGHKTVPVRSALYSNSIRGISAYDWGANRDGSLADVGEYVGVVSAQALGERGVNLSMKQVHMAGAATKGGSVLSGMDVVQKLLHMPRKSPDYAILSSVRGKVDKIEPGSAGGHVVHVGDEDFFVPAFKQLTVKKGDAVQKGQPLSNGYANPRELATLRGIDDAREYLVEQVYNIYRPEGILRRNVEVLVRAMTDSVKITDPGDAPFIRGEDATESAVRSWISKNPEQKKPKYEHVLHGTNMAPLHVIEDVVGKMGYQRMRDTVTRAAAEAETTDLAGRHPIPTLVYGGKP